MISWSYLAQRALTGEFLDVDLPLARDELSWALSGAGSLRGTLSPDVGSLRAADGRLVLEEWGTFIYAEADGEIRWGGILVHSSFAGESWEIEAASFATYPHGLHYDNARTWIQADPVEPFKELWANAQWRPNARLGVQVYAPPTGLKIGLRGTQGDNSPIWPGDVSNEKWIELKAAGWQERNGGLYPPARVLRSVVGDVEFQRLVDDEDWVEEKVYNLTDGATFVKAEGLEPGKADFIQSWGWRLGSKDVTDDNQNNPVVGYLGLPWTEKKSRYADPPKVKVDAEPYALSWWETQDIGQKIDDLVSATPFDFTERHFWVPDEPFVDVGEGMIDDDVLAWLITFGWYGKADDGLDRLYRPDALELGSTSTIAPAISEYLLANGWYGRADDNAERIYRPATSSGQIGHIVRVHYPRAGARRDDLVFVQGDNITDVVSPTFDGDEYANSVTGIGSGEGALALRQEIAVDDGRLYRAALYTDKGLDDSGTLSAKVRDELTRRQNLLRITEVTVRDHDNARIGTWQLGDDVLIQADLPWLGAVDLWCRITGWSLITDDTARLTLERSDSFRYGG